jgi:hypothetical protein
MKMGADGGDKLVKAPARTGGADVGRAAFLAAIRARPGNQDHPEEGAWMLVDADQPGDLLPAAEGDAGLPRRNPS